MRWRVVVVSSRAKLELKLGYLVVRGTEVRRVLLDEISVLLIENTGCVISVALMEALWEHKIDVVFCDSHHFPSALLVSLNGNYETSARLSVQLAWTKEAKEAVWSAIIKEKINKQAHALRMVGNVAMIARKTAPTMVILDITFCKYSSVALPGRIPGIKPPLAFILSATSDGLKVIAV